MTADVNRYRLANGIEVVLAPEPGSPRVVVDIWYRGGAAVEQPGQEGWAHLVEHILLRGSRHISKAKQNATFSLIGGERDGFTQLDHAGLYAAAPANQLETLLWMRSDQVGFWAPLDEAALETEKEIVLNEVVQRERRPTIRTTRRTFELMFPRPHPYHGWVDGDVESIRRARPEAVRRFMEANFNAARMIVVIGGGFAVADAQKLVAKYLGTLPAGTAAPLPSPTPAVVTTEKRDDVREEIADPRVTFAWPIPAPFEPARAALDLVPFLLGDTPASILRKRLVQAQHLAESVACTVTDARASSVLSCEVKPAHGVAVERVAAEADAVFAALRSGLAAEDVERAKISWRASLLRDNEDLVARTHSLAGFYLYTGRTDFLREQLASGAAVTVESLRQAAARWLSPTSRIVITARPEPAS